MSPMVKKSEMYKKMTEMHAMMREMLELQYEILDAPKPGKADDEKPSKRKVGRKKSS